MADWLARSVLADQRKCSPADLRFIADRGGKPRLKGEDESSFSLSHSGDWIVCAAGGPRLGADVEEIRPFDPASAEEFLSNEERREIARKSELNRKDEYYRIWTLKESYAKALGLGLALPFRDLSVRFGRSGNPALGRDGKILKNAFFKQVRLDDRHVLSICSLAEQIPENVIRRDVSRLLRIDPRSCRGTARTE